MIRYHALYPAQLPDMLLNHFAGEQKQKEAELRKGYEATQQGLRAISMEERVALTMQKVDLMEDAKRAKAVVPAPPAMDMKDRVAMTMSKLAEHQAAQKAMARAQVPPRTYRRLGSKMHMYLASQFLQ